MRQLASDKPQLPFSAEAAAARARRERQVAAMFAGVNLLVFGILASCVVVAAVLYEHWG
jgi:hypothetical protein